MLPLERKSISRLVPNISLSPYSNDCPNYHPTPRYRTWSPPLHPVDPVGTLNGTENLYESDGCSREYS